VSDFEDDPDELGGDSPARKKPDERKLAWDFVLGNASGRKVLIELIEKTGFMAAPQFKGQSNQTFFELGRQSVGHNLFSQIRHEFPDRFLVLIKEMFDE
jgi:hypothetical protein